MQHDLWLTRGTITLRPLQLDDAAAMLGIVDEPAWQGMSTPAPRSVAQCRAHLAALVEPATTLAFAVEQDGRFVGHTTLYDIVDGLRCELGSTYYAPAVWGSAVNPTAKLLLLGHAFDELGMGRVALRCDSRNTRSRAAISRLGARFEGSLRRFRYAADGSVVDVDYFSILRDEWPAVRAGLLARLEE